MKRSDSGIYAAQRRSAKRERERRESLERLDVAALAIGRGDGTAAELLAKAGRYNREFTSKNRRRKFTREKKIEAE